MDEVMERRWRTGHAPFDGSTVRSPELRAEELRELLLNLVPVLLEEDVELVTFLDWHEHDGYVVTSDVVDRTVLTDSLSTPGKFIAASSDDTFVRRAWYPPDGRFLLRWCISSDPDDFGLPPGAPAGDVDITGADELARGIAALLPGSTVTPAKAFFDRTWAG